MQIMHFIPHGFDLNLLAVFDALYRYGNVAKAADSLFISPSAFSHALNRLREALNDPLFIRMQGKMVPTKRAEEIAPSITESLKLLSSHLFELGNFEPLTSDYEFVIATTDYTAFIILPLLLERLRKVAPNIKLKFISEKKEESFRNLSIGTVDLIIGYAEQDEVLPQTIDVYECFSDDYVVVAPKGLYSSMTLQDYSSASHIRISSWNTHNGIIDETLRAEGIVRNIALELPNMMITPYLMASSDLIITLPNRAINLLKQGHSIDIFKLPIEIPKYKINLYCNNRDKIRPPQTWLIKEITSLFTE